MSSHLVIAPSYPLDGFEPGFCWGGIVSQNCVAGQPSSPVPVHVSIFSFQFFFRLMKKLIKSNQLLLRQMAIDWPQFCRLKKKWKERNIWKKVAALTTLDNTWQGNKEFTSDSCFSLSSLSFSLFISLSFSLSSLFFSRVCNISLCISLFLIWCFYVLYFFTFYLSVSLSFSLYIFIFLGVTVFLSICVPLSLATSLRPSIHLSFCYFFLFCLFLLYVSN